MTDIDATAAPPVIPHQVEPYAYCQPYHENSALTRDTVVRVSRTPGNKLVYIHEKKRGTQPKCGDCGAKLPGVSL